MINPLANVYGSLLITRPPVPATVNKAGANYKSEVTHSEYSPQRAFDEWRSICQAIVDCGGDALFRFEEVDEKFLDTKALHVDGDGNISAEGSSEVIDNIDNIETGRVFTANGPWVTVEGKLLRAAMQHMLPHRVTETSYYREILEAIATQGDYQLSIADNPHRWEGMADVAVVGDKVVLTYAVPGHYDEGIETKSSRSCKAGVSWAADQVGVPEDARIYAELVYPHFHGDTVHFAARPTQGQAVLVHYQGGLWGTGADDVTTALGGDRIVAIGCDDAVEQYGGNSRQVDSGILIPDKTSAAFEQSLMQLGLSCHRVPLFELFGKAGGGPGCATLYLPSNLELAEESSLRFSKQQEAVTRRRDRLPAVLRVDPEFYAGRRRG